MLVVDRVGKSVSGGGGDPNITGRFPSTYISGGPDVTRLVYLAMTEDSDGTATASACATSSPPNSRRAGTRCRPI